jgi:hypothetical protein
MAGNIVDKCLTISPEQLKADAVCSTVLALSIPMSILAEIRLRVFELHQSPMNLTSGNAPQGQPGRQFGAEIRPEEPVARLFIVRHSTDVDKIANAVKAGLRAALELVCFEITLFMWWIGNLLARI